MEQIKTVPFRTDTVLSDYIPVPRAVAFTKMPSTAILIYGALLNRATLSQKNGFADDLGRVYVIYPIAELSKALSISDTAVKRNLSLLESVGLIQRIRLSMTKANHIYLFLPEGNLSPPVREQKDPCESTKTTRHRVQKGPPNNYKETHKKTRNYNYGEDESL